MALIEKVEVFMVDLQPKISRSDAIQSFVSQETPIVRITDSDGAEGVGYTYTIGTGGHSIIELLRRTLVPRLLGQEATHIEARWRELLFATHATSVGPITSLAIACIDIALWDLRAKKAGLPLHVIAGGAKTSIPVYSTEGGWLNMTEDALVKGALEAKTRGLKGSKVKVGLSINEDRSRLSAVRNAVGEDFDLFVDANQSFSLDEGIRRAHSYEGLNIGWIEEPFEADDVCSHAQLMRQTSIPIAVGESLYSVRQFSSYLQAQACSIIQVDVARVGGITPWLKVAHLAESFNVAVCPHFLMEIHVSLCCATSSARWLEYIPQLESITKNKIIVENGVAIPPQKSGIGIEWDWSIIKATMSKEYSFTSSISKIRVKAI